MLARIRLRLAAWNLLVLALVLGVTLGSAIVSEVRTAELAIDHELRDGAARAAAKLLREQHGGHGDGHDREDDDGPREDGKHDRPRHAGRSEHDDAEHDDAEHDDAEHDDDLDEISGLLFFTVGANGGAVRSDRRAAVRGLPDERALHAALEGEELAGERSAAGEPVRLLTVPVVHDGRVVGAVQVVKTVRESDAALSRTIFTLILTGAAGLVLSAAGSWFLAGRAMRPIADALERQRRFIADASHELRTPVAVLRARAELLQREGEPLPPAAREEVDRLHRDTEELSALLGDLLDLARLDAAEGALEVEPVALGDVVEEVVEQLAPLARERSISLSAKASPVWARAHLGRARQVLRALADNALKHTPAGGHVVVAVAARGDRARLSVTDDGEGIAPEHLPHVFDRFYRADAARAGGDEGARRGTGLGLSIAAQIVKAMGGEIAVDSAPGKGTTVTVDLPLSQR